MPPVRGSYIGLRQAFFQPAGQRRQICGGFQRYLFTQSRAMNRCGYGSRTTASESLRNSTRGCSTLKVINEITSVILNLAAS